MLAAMMDKRSNRTGAGRVVPRLRPAAALLAGLFAVAPAPAAEPCGLCAVAVAINPPLAQCLLDRYATLATSGNGVIAVDLSDCETERGIVEALPAVGGEPDEPDLKFILSRPQLDCLKSRLEEPGLVRDPVTRIDLGTCG
ncbi:hypothetical protein [Nitratireductor alexandrii]|uniref:hypothetical protein n=1 Tax=Nitratireductor alexandrii TaxID=2448161 RepID=UPI001EE87EDA|nr:hypothetical protein [Nitratireductor alexandrii]